MRIGTKSVLVGYHAFWLHPFFVAEGWRRIYGFPWDPRLWVAFFVHDLGYFGKPNMDGAEGETHPCLGAFLMYTLFDFGGSFKWTEFCLYHSRSWARANSASISKLAYADKLAFLLYPLWLMKVLFKLSGEFEEYRRKTYGVQVACEAMTFEQWYEEAKPANVKTLKEINYAGNLEVS